MAKEATHQTRAKKAFLFSVYHLTEYFSIFFKIKIDTVESSYSTHHPGGHHVYLYRSLNK